MRVCISGAAIAATLTLSAGWSHAGLLNLTQTEEAREDWVGFGAYLQDDDWVGQTVVYRPPGWAPPPPAPSDPGAPGNSFLGGYIQNGGPIGSTLTIFSGHNIFQSTPLAHLHSAQYGSTAQARARAGDTNKRRHVGYGQQLGGTITQSGQLADSNLFAQVVRPDQWMLANGSAVSSLSTGITSDRYSVTGNVSASTSIRRLNNAHASAWSGSWAAATYTLDEACTFDLRVNFGQLGTADLSFAILDAKTGETVLEINAEDSEGEWHSREYTGQLEAGRYRLVSKASSASEMNRVGKVLKDGGEAGFSITLEWRRKFDYMAYAQPMSLAMVPEPVSAAAVLPLLAGLMLRRRA